MTQHRQQSPWPKCGYIFQKAKLKTKDMLQQIQFVICAPGKKTMRVGSYISKVF